MKLEESVAQYIQANRLLSPGEKILVGVSGGPDSLCLMAVLQDLGYDLRIAHFDHSLRKESGADADFVRSIAAQRGISVSMGRGDVRQYARSNRKTLEESARLLRYEFLVREARQFGLSAVATGHTRDDQAETVVMHLLRGSGLHGLRGMRPSHPADHWFESADSASVRLIRPLLAISRIQTETYCREHGLTPLHDASNQDPTFWRNRIRTNLIPELRKYNPRIIDTLCGMAEVLAAQAEYIDRQVEIRWIQMAQMDGPDQVRLRRLQVNAEPMAIRQGIIRKAFQCMRPGLRDFARRHVDQVVEFCETLTHTGRADLALGVKIFIEGDWVVFRRGGQALPENTWEQILLPAQGRISITQPDWMLDVAIVETADSRQKIDPNDPWQAWMDLDRLTLPLMVRSLRTGERWEPIGLGKSVNLANFLAKSKIPAAQRWRYPLVCDQRGVCWVPGIRLGETARLTAATRKCVYIRIHRDK